MATTTVASGLRVQKWDAEFFTEYHRKSRFARYTGRSENSIIQVKEGLGKMGGDSITYSVVNRLKQDATRGAVTLAGNEEAMKNRSQRVTVELIRHGVEIDTKTEQIKTEIDLRNAAKSGLMTWAKRLLRDDTIQAFMSIDGTKFADADATARNTWLTNNSDRVLFGAAKSNAVSNVWATAAATIDNSADKLTPQAVSLMKEIARDADPYISPVTVNEDEEWFVLFVSNLGMRDLKTNTDMMQANRDARERGENNPLWTGGDLLWDGVIIKEIPEIPKVTSSIQIAPAFFCGSQALGLAYAQTTRSVEDTPRDYGRLLPIGVEEIRKVEKLRFGTDSAADTTTPKDWGMVTGWFAAVASA